MLYGDYLAELLGDAAVGDRPRTRRWRSTDGAVRLADGGRVEAEAVVLAPGNFTPATPRGVDPAALGAALGRGSLGGGLHRGPRRGRRRASARHRPHRGRRRFDPRRDRLCAAGSSLCRDAAWRRAPTACASRWWRRRTSCRRPAPRCFAGCGCGPKRSAGGARCTNCARSPRSSGQAPASTSGGASSAICGPGGTSTATRSRPRSETRSKRCRRRPA